MRGRGKYCCILHSGTNWKDRRYKNQYAVTFIDSFLHDCTFHPVCHIGILIFRGILKLLPGNTSLRDAAKNAYVNHLVPRMACTCSVAIRRGEVSPTNWHHLWLRFISVAGLEDQIRLVLNEGLSDLVHIMAQLWMSSTNSAGPQLVVWFERMQGLVGGGGSLRVIFCGLWPVLLPA